MKNIFPPLKDLENSHYVREIYCLYEIAKTLNATLDLTQIPPGDLEYFIQVPGDEPGHGQCVEPPLFRNIH